MALQPLFVFRGDDPEVSRAAAWGSAGRSTGWGCHKWLPTHCSCTTAAKPKQTPNSAKVNSPWVNHYHEATGEWWAQKWPLAFSQQHSAHSDRRSKQHDVGQTYEVNIMWVKQMEQMTQCGSNNTMWVKGMEQTTQCGSNNTMWVKQMEQTTQCGSNRCSKQHNGSFWSL